MYRFISRMRMLVVEYNQILVVGCFCCSKVAGSIGYKNLFSVNSATEGADSRPISGGGTPTEDQAGQIGNGNVLDILL